MGSGLFTLISAVIGLGSFFWIIVAIVAVILIVHYSNKKSGKNTRAYDEQVRNGIVHNSEVGQVAPPEPPKKKNPYAYINAMLLTGSVLLVIGIIKFTNDANDSLVAPVAIALTLIFYALGYFLYKKFEYLKVVGIAFSYISLAIFPFWVISFNFFGMSWHGAWILSSIITFLAILTTTFLYKSKVTSYFTYIWLFMIAWSCTPEIDTHGGVNVAAYWNFVASGLIALIPTVLWKLKPDWLPVFFRKATMTFSGALMPTVALFAIWLFVVPEPMIYIPFLRTIMIALFLAWTALYYSITRSYGWFVFARFIAQGLLLTITMDALNFSLISTSLYKVSDAVKLGIITVWLISFLVQTMISLFIPKKDAYAQSVEHRAEVASLIGIFITPIFTSGLEDPLGAVVNLIICLVIAVLGISYAIVHKNPKWTIATTVALCFARMVIIGSTLAQGWNEWSDLIYFTIVSGAIVLMYQFFRKYNEKETFAITIIELIVALCAVVYSAFGANYAEIGWLIAALYFALFGYMSKQTVLYEVSIYSGALCLYSLAGTVGEFVLPESAQKCIEGPVSFMRSCPSASAAATYTNWIASINVIRSFIIGGALTAVSLLKELNYEPNRRFRFFFGYIIMSIGLYMVGLTAGEYWMLFCLSVQVAYLIYGAINDVEWLVWVTIFAMPICSFSLAGGFTYLWFVTVGLTLIGIVIWRLTKINRAKLAEEAKQKPAAPKQQ